MNGTTIATSTTVGVSLTAASQNPVTIAPSGTVNVAGSYASAIYAALGVPSTLANDGVLQAADGYGVRFRAGGTITNGSASDTKASISGGVNGVQFDIHGTGKLSNFGTIRSTGTGSGIYGLSTDNIANGSTSDGVALIAGYQTGISMNGLTATIANFGMISASGTSSTGIYFRQGGVVTNGDATHTAASVTGVQFGINMAHNEGTVGNFGTIAGSGPQGRGVNLNAGGTVVNGSNSDTAAYILAAGPRAAVYIGGSAGSVTNFGTIKSAGRTGVVLDPGGTVTNGSATDTKALISGARSGVYMRADAASAVVNFGTISGAQKSGVNIYQDGQITNGSTADSVALIEGRNGIYLGSGTIVNFGTVTGSLTSGISIGESALIINGDATHKNALISNTVTTAQHSALYVNLGAATINNFGTIKSASASAIHLNNGGTITNGSTADTTALIQGSTSGSSVIIQAGQTTINNFGTIGNGASGASGINLGEGGSIVNGSAASTKASILGGSGTVGNGIFVNSGSASIANFATISGGGTGIGFGNNGTVGASAAGTVVNGSTAVTTSLITGSINGIFANGSIGVTNFASITASTFGGISLGGGGSIANGSAADTKASIIGGAGTSGSGIFVSAGAATVTNLATISGGGTGIGFGNNGTVGASGTVVNGSAAVNTARIIGGSGTTGTGISINSGSLGVSNFGTVSGGDDGINFGSNGSVKAAGTVVNGSTAVTTSLITGSINGIFANGSIGVTNFASITASTFGGISLGGGGSIANGSAADTKASIIGGAGTSGSGIFVSAGAATVTNLATISGGGTGIGFGNNGTVGASGTVVNGSAAVNTARIIGGSGTTGTGISINSGSLGVSNFGTVSGGDDGINFGSNGSVKAAGTVVNGSTAVTTSLITGSINGIFANGSIGVTNFASITASTFGGISLGGGGSIANGSAADTKASIIGGAGTSGSGIFVSAGAATVTNLATISGGGTGIGFGNNGTAGSSGAVVNGSTAVTTAKIIGGSGTTGTGIFINSGSLGVSNFGTVSGGNTGIDFGSNGTVAATGTVVNGSTAVTTSLITGSSDGIFANGSVGVANFASIAASTFSAIFLGSGGSIANGSAADTRASIIGGSGTVGNGIFVGTGTATVKNFATISGATGISFGNNGTVGSSGTVVNGGAAVTTAKIIGGSGTVGAGIFISMGSVAVTNFATIAGAGIGIDFGSNGTSVATGSVVNGSTADTTAAITGSFNAIFANGGPIKITNYGTMSGNTAISLANGTIGSAGTVENFGNIVSNFGTSGTAIQFGGLVDRLILHPGASIVGKVFGGAGSNTLELASGGAGTVGSIGTNFMGFTALAVDGGTTWTLTGNNAIGTVTDNGSLTLAPSASLHVTTAVDPASTGIFKLDASSLLEVLADKGISNKIQFIGTSELIVDTAANFGTNVGKTTYNGPLIQSFTTGDKIDLKDVAASATLNYTAATGLLQISNAATAVATLKFDNATLGFNGTDDGTGHMLITHS